MKICHFMILVLLQVGSLWPASVSADQSLTMRVVPIVLPSKEVQLDFDLRYDGDQSFEADVGTLPGVQARNVVALDADRFPDWDNQWAGNPCPSFREIISINEPSPGWRLVSGGQQFHERVALSDLYSGVEGSIGRCDIVINWSYKLYTKNKVRFPRMAGSVVIPSSMLPIVPPDVSVVGAPWKGKESDTRGETSVVP